MSKHVGEKCGKQLNGDPDEQRVSWTDRMRPGRPDITLP